MSVNNITLQKHVQEQRNVIQIKHPPVVLPDELARMYDFRNVCRICASVSDHILQMYSEGEKYGIVTKIRKYLPLKLHAGERMPHGICTNCASTVLSWHELVQSARLADFMLRRRLDATLPDIPIQRPSATTGNEVTKDGVNESLNWNIIEIKEAPEQSCEEYEQMGEQQSLHEELNESKVAEKPKVLINENGKRYVSCDTCKKNVAMSSWQRHRRAHRGERRYSCHTCGMAFSDSGNLARHSRARHARQRPHICPDCGRAFARKTHLQDHMHSHRDDREYVCDICGKASKSAAALRMHVRTHDARCRFQCMECGSKFKRNTELRAHVTIHTGERAHLCGCGRAFRLRSQLTAHARTHNAKPKVDQYVDVATDAPALPTERYCSNCSLMIPAKKFNSHMYTKHGSTSFRCDECHCYLDKSDLLFHMDNHAFSRLPEHVQAEYYKNEAAFLEEDAKLEALADIEVAKVDEIFRRREARMREEEEIRKREKQNEKNSQPSEENNESVEKESIDPNPRTESSPKSSSQEVKNDTLEDDKSNVTTEPPKEDPPKCAGEEVQNDTPQTNKVCDDTVTTKKKLPKCDNDKLKTKASLEQDSDVNRSPPKRKRIDPKQSSDAELSPAKRPRKNKRGSAKSGRKAKEFDDKNDGVEEVNVRAIKVEEEDSDKSPKTSRTCPICGKQYRASSSYFYHMKYFHKRSREHECSVCNKKFGTKASLTQHASSIHTGAYDLECKECGKRFKSKPSLYIHEQSHSGTKRWACSLCGRSFRWRTHLARHVSRHVAERAHVCGTCGRGFSVRCDLLRHARTHAADEFHCVTCGLKFAQKRYLQVHVVKKHSEASPSPAVTRS